MKIAYKHNGVKNSNVAVVFAHGLMSDMEGGKALFLEQWCNDNNIEYCRYDAYGHGQSATQFNQKFTNGTISQWKDDLIYIIEEVIQNKNVIIVGSSMGGWVGLLATVYFNNNNNKNIVGMVGIAPAPDFTREIFASFNDDQKTDLYDKGVAFLPSDYGDPYPISEALINDGENNILLDDDININQPVVILQGQQDNSVEWETALFINNRLTSDQVYIHFVKDGDHSLSRPQDLELLAFSIQQIIKLNN